MDAGSSVGPWTEATLRAIDERPATRAATLAESFGRDAPSFTSDVRRLKALGLTESLEVGYRLSPRGRAFLARLAPERR
jgi:Mn-dependent DtxR family transcriptional regulator